MIVVANLLSSRLDELLCGLCAALQTSLNREVRFAVDATLDDFREARVDAVLLCGLAYSLLHDATPERFAPIAALVPDDDRGQGMAVYFSDIVVPTRSDARQLHDLQGARLAYNEAISFSGYRALEHQLRRCDLSWSFFGERVQTGSHRESLARVADGVVDVAVIDSHVLRLETGREPELADRIRTVASLGPYPSPPIAINTRLLGGPAERIVVLLDCLPDDVLRAAAVRRWQPVDDRYYDAIRKATENLAGLAV